MTVRLFDGVDDKITTALGALGFAFGPGTLVILQKALADSVLWTPMVVGNVSTARYGLRRNASNQAQVTLNGNNTTGPAGTGIIVSDGWAITAVTKATGTVAPRYHQLRLSDGNISHLNGGSTVANSSIPTTQARIGSAFAGTSEFFNGEIAVLAVWNVVLSDAQIEELWANRRTSDWWNNSAGRPRALWEFAQADVATPVADLSGNGATQNAIVGTTVVTNDDPPGWVFDGTGAAPQALTLSLADVVAAADAAVPAVARAQSFADVVAGTDAAALARAIAATFPETLAVTDAASTAQAIKASLADAALVVDGDAEAVSRPLSIADVVAAADALTAAAAAARTLSLADLVAASDSAATSAAAARSLDLADTLVAADATAADRSFRVADALLATDGRTIARAVVRSFADDLLANDAAESTIVVPLALADGVDVADVVLVDRAADLRVDVADVVAVDDAVAFERGVMVADVLLASDVAHVARALTRGLADELLADDVVGMDRATFLVVADDLLVVDAIEDAVGTSFALADLLAAGDVVVALWGGAPRAVLVVFEQAARVRLGERAAHVHLGDAPVRSLVISSRRNS